MSKAKSQATDLVVLTPLERAQAVLKFDETKAALADMATKSERILDLNSDAAYAECHSARMLLKQTRVNIEKAGKLAREDSTAFSKAVIATENELVALIEPEEKRLAKLQDEVDNAKKLEKERAAEAERQRIAEINARFDKLKALPGKALNQPTAMIKSLLAEAEGFDQDAFPDDMQAAARFEKRNVIAQLRAALDAREAFDAEQVQIEKDRAELAEMKRQQAERDAAAEAQRVEQERLQREQEAREKAEREAAEAADQERRRAEIAEQERVAAAERAEADRLAKVERDRIAAEQAARHQAAEKEATRIAAEQRAEAERLAEQARQLEAREIANASLLEAATEALVILQKDYPRSKVTKKLAAAIAREPQSQKAA